VVVVQVHQVVVVVPVGIDIIQTNLLQWGITLLLLVPAVLVVLQTQ
jgi:hypothetical protein